MSSHEPGSTVQNQSLLVKCKTTTNRLRPIKMKSLPPLPARAPCYHRWVFSVNKAIVLCDAANESSMSFGLTIFSNSMLTVCLFLSFWLTGFHFHSQVSISLPSSISLPISPEPSAAWTKNWWPKFATPSKEGQTNKQHSNLDQTYRPWGRRNQQISTLGSAGRWHRAFVWWYFTFRVDVLCWQRLGERLRVLFPTLVSKNWDLCPPFSLPRRALLNKHGKGDVARVLKRDLSLDSHCSICLMIRLIRSRWVWALSLVC